MPGTGTETLYFRRKKPSCVASRPSSGVLTNWESMCSLMVRRFIPDRCIGLLQDPWKVIPRDYENTLGVLAGVACIIYYHSAHTLHCISDSSCIVLHFHKLGILFK